MKNIQKKVNSEIICLVAVRNRRRKSYLNLPALTCTELHLPKFTWIYLNLPKCTWIDQNFPEFTLIYLNIPEFTRIYLILHECTWIYLYLPGFIWIHLVVSEYLIIFRDIFKTSSKLVPIIFPPLFPSISWQTVNSYLPWDAGHRRTNVPAQSSRPSAQRQRQGRLAFALGPVGGSQLLRLPGPKPV